MKLPATTCLALLFGALLPGMSAAEGETAREASEATWNVEREVDPILDTMNITASLRARGEQKSLFGDGKFLVLRCRESELNLYVIWGRFRALGRSRRDASGQDVTLRFDKNEPRTEPWGRSTNDNATFAPQLGEFAARLRQHQRLALRTHPTKGGSLTAVFDLSNAGAVVEEVTGACAG